MPPKNGSGFQATVLTHLAYIKEKQDKHDDALEKVFDKLESQRKGVYKALEQHGSENEKAHTILETGIAGNKTDLDNAKGFAKAMIIVVGVTGVVIGYIVSLVSKFWPGK